LSFGVHKNRTAALPIDSTQFVVEVATDYNPINNTGTFVALSYPTLMPQGWSLITIDGSIIPLTSNLAIRFRQNQELVTIRIDDIILTGTPKDAIYENGTWVGTPTIDRDVIIR